jgi:predicted short-subunit dehydrogenase-like oxidoreductase (DUF2520 family)
MKIVFLGSGNVATHLALAFNASGQQITQVWSRKKVNAEQLAAQVNASAIEDLSSLDRNADLYLIAVKDDAIIDLVPLLLGLEGVVVHTSGATPLDVLQGLENYGVFYPLQTFSKQKALDLSNTPMCLEANSAAAMQVIEAAAKLISTAQYRMDSEQRKVLHLAAVFACNFTNHLYQLGHSILQTHGLNFEILKPLILETARKIEDAVPFDVQTGPAVRGDQETMVKHLRLLDDRPDLQGIYKTLSESIKKTHL